MPRSSRACWNWSGPGCGWPTRWTRPVSPSSSKRCATRFFATSGRDGWTTPSAAQSRTPSTSPNEPPMSSIRVIGPSLCSPPARRASPRRPSSPGAISWRRRRRRTGCFPGAFGGAVCGRRCCRFSTWAASKCSCAASAAAGPCASTSASTRRRCCAMPR